MKKFFVIQMYFIFVFTIIFYPCTTYAQSMFSCDANISSIFTPYKMLKFLTSVQYQSSIKGVMSDVLSCSYNPFTKIYTLRVNFETKAWYESAYCATVDLWSSKELDCIDYKITDVKSAICKS